MAKAAEIEGLDCEMTALAGAVLVLRTRLEEMCALREQALDFSDLKGVHDMRVASRRLRSAARDFLPFLPRRVPRRRLKALAGALGNVRDEDVAIKMLDELRATTEGGVAVGLLQFADERRWRREHARSVLEDAMSEQALAALREKFISSLEKQVEIESRSQVSSEKSKRGDQSQSCTLSFRQAGRQIILHRLDELRELSSSLYRPFASQPLHRLRIAAKRLRYAMELCAQCWPDDLEAFAHEVARLQKSLGELHDCDVLIEELGARLSSAKGSSPDSASGADDQTPERRAAIWLLQHIVKERSHHFRAALARWHEWETTGFFSPLSTALETMRASTL